MEEASANTLRRPAYWTTVVDARRKSDQVKRSRARQVIGQHRFRREGLMLRLGDHRGILHRSSADCFRADRVEHLPKPGTWEHLTFERDDRQRPEVEGAGGYHLENPSRMRIGRGSYLPRYVGRP